MELRSNTEGTVIGGDGKIQATGYKEIDHYMRTGFSEVQKFTEFEILSLYIYVLCRDAAACTTLFKSKFLTTSGDSVVHNGCWTFVFKKFGAEWKVVQENGTHTH